MGVRQAEPETADDLKKKRPPLRKVLPEIWTLIKPRRWLLAFGFRAHGH